jgi:hypothetical protein
MKCCMCQREREAFKTVKLTDVEKAFVQRHTTGVPPDEYVYCKACWQVATNRIQGPQLMKGLLQIQYQRAGVRNAEALATRVQDFFVKKAASKPIS